MSGVFPVFPTRAGLGNRFAVAIIKQHDNAFIIADLVAHGAVGQKQELGIVGIFILGRQPDRLHFGVAIGFGTMGQPACRIIGPKQGVDGLHPFFDPGHHHGTLFALQRFGEQRGQGPFQRHAGEMVKPDISHKAVLART